MKKSLRIYSAVLVLSLLSVFAGCTAESNVVVGPVTQVTESPSSDPLTQITETLQPSSTTTTPSSTNTPRIGVQGIRMSESALNLTVGQTVEISAEVIPENATDKRILYSVSDEKVISYAEGVLTALAAGSAVLTAETIEDGYIARCTVTVTEADPTTVTPPVPTITPDTTTPTPQTTSTPADTTTTTPDDPTTVTPPVDDEPKAYTPFYPEEKLVAFTFDDGPDWWTPYILDTLKDGDTVTFFITGYMIEHSATTTYPDGYYAEFTKRALEMGCEIGIHAYYHEHNVYFKSREEDASEEVIKREVYDLADKYEALFGVRPHLYRPQGGGFNPSRNYGFALALWSIDSLDHQTFEEYRDRYGGSFTGISAEYDYLREQAAHEIVERILADLKPGDIVLMHDIFNISRMAFAEIYPILKEQGYKLVTVSELLGINPEEHHGQYFFASYHYGYMNTDRNLTKTTTPPVYNLPPKKDETEA